MYPITQASSSRPLRILKDYHTFLSTHKIYDIINKYDE